MLLVLTCVTAADTRARDVEQIVGRLAERAKLHQSLLYRLQCQERVSRAVYRDRTSAAGFGYRPGEMMELSHEILIVRDEIGSPE